MRAITIEDLNAAAHIGGAGSLVMRQELEPASGPDGVIAIPWRKSLHIYMRCASWRGEKNP